VKEKLLLFVKESSISMNAKQKKWGVQEKSSLSDALNGQRKTRDFSPITTSLFQSINYANLLTHVAYVF